MADDPKTPPPDDDKTQIAQPLPPIEDDDKTQIAQPLPPAEDDDRTLIAQPLPAVDPPTDPDTSYWDEPTVPPGLSMPPSAPMPDMNVPAQDAAGGDLSLPPGPDAPAETTGLSMPPVSDVPELARNLTSPPPPDAPEASIPPVEDEWGGDAVTGDDDLPAEDPIVLDGPLPIEAEPEAADPTPEEVEGSDPEDVATNDDPFATPDTSEPPTAGVAEEAEVPEPGDADPFAASDAEEAEEPDTSAIEGVRAVEVVEASDPQVDDAIPEEPASEPQAQEVTSPSLAPVAAAATVIVGGGTTDASVPPPAPKPDVTPPTESNQTTPVPIGTLINNNYEIKQMINAGGMGEVFRGENVFTGDAVAIKIVLQSLANDEKVAALFMREAKVLCQLSDQAIVRYYNFVRDADLDRFCLIMEFIEGRALSEHIKEVAPLTLVQAAGLMRRVAEGLDRAHRMDVIHRDLSPDNVMLRDGSVDNAVLIDFGIAKSAEMAESTLHGQLAGKFKYISPEQLGHFGGEIGPRTDIYGLGLMMAAALRGQPLDMGSSVVEAVNARREIPDLSEIDPALRPLLAHMLEPDPAHRPARMSDVLALLDNPATIPQKYGQAQPIATGSIVQTTIAPATHVPGLSQPPGRSPTTMGFGNTTGIGSASPFGQQTGLDPMPAPEPEPEQSATGGALRWVLVLLIFGAIGGFFAWQQGLIGPQPTVVTSPDPQNGPDDGGPADLDPSSREGFLAAATDDPCSYATRITAGPQSGTIAAYSTSTAAFDGLADAYFEQFGARPAVNETIITPEQCPALALANALRTQTANAPILFLDTDEIQSGGSIVGKLTNRSGRPVWLAWVSDKGGVYNLTDRLSDEQADGSRTFVFSLTAQDGDGATPQLLIAVASDNPLIAAAASAPGSSGANLLPLIEAEIAGRDDDRAGLAVVGFDLSP